MNLIDGAKKGIATAQSNKIIIRCAAFTEITIVPAIQFGENN